MKPYSVKFRHVREFTGARCINPCCGKRVKLNREKICPNCGKRSVESADKERCDDCHALLDSGDYVCPLCGSKQRFIVELRSFSPENLTACAHLLHKGRPSMSLAECRKQCRRITTENPYRLSFFGKPEQIRPFIRDWNALQGTAVACLGRETSRRPVVLIHSYNRQNTSEHARLLLDIARKSDFAALTIEKAIAVLHGINKAEKPFRLRFTSDFDRIEAWVAAWRKLGGTAVRSPEHM